MHATILNSCTTTSTRIDLRSVSTSKVKTRRHQSPHMLAHTQTHAVIQRKDRIWVPRGCDRPARILYFFWELPRALADWRRSGTQAVASNRGLNHWQSPHTLMSVHRSRMQHVLHQRQWHTWPSPSLACPSHRCFLIRCTGWCSRLCGRLQTWSGPHVQLQQVLDVALRVRSFQARLHLGSLMLGAESKRVGMISEQSSQSIESSMLTGQVAR